ncbi:MAG: hypothetical protein J6X07_11620 [Prevotella sp.]|nr:hypothetical protein [Prevotella sp.]
MILALSASAQRKQIGEARTYLKTGKNLDKAERLMTDLLKDSANQDNKRIYEIWLQSVQKQYEQANERLYTHKQQDTAQFFSLVRRMFSIAFCMDSLDIRPDKKGRVAPELRKDVARDMINYRPNLFFGGAYYVRKSDFQKAYDFFETYLDCTRQPLFTGYDPIFAEDSRMEEASYWACYCGYRMNDPLLALRHRELALRDSSKRDMTFQYVAESWRILHDDSMYVATLQKGFLEYPTSNYFFPRLMDAFTQKGQYRKALAIVDIALEADSLNELYLFAKSNVLMQQERYAESLKYTDKLLTLNDKQADAYYNGGSAYLNIALRMDPQRHKKQVRDMYQKALPYMERYRALAPSETQKWGPALYRIYFNLNMGKQFDEIDKILKK